MCSYRSGDFRGIYAKYIILASHWEMPDFTPLCGTGGSDGGGARSCLNLTSINQSRHWAFIEKLQIRGYVCYLRYD